MQGAQVGPSVKLSFSHLLYRRYIIIIHAASNIDALQARENELNKHAAAVNLHYSQLCILHRENLKKCTLNKHYDTFS